MSEQEKDPIVVTPKHEKVEYWHFVGNGGAAVTYMVRIERGERANVLLNQIDNSPIEVQLLLRNDDDKNEIAGRLCFPIANLFSYGMEMGTFAVYPAGYSPAEMVAKDNEKKHHDGLLMRKRRMEAVVGKITDLADPSVDALPPDA